MKIEPYFGRAARNGGLNAGTIRSGVLCRIAGRHCRVDVGQPALRGDRHNLSRNGAAGEHQHPAGAGGGQAIASSGWRHRDHRSSLP